MLHFYLCRTLAASYQNRKLSFLSNSQVLHFWISAKNSKGLELGWFVSSLAIISKSFSKHKSQLKSGNRDCCFKPPSMADLGCSWNWVCWAKFLQPFINTNYKLHLFRANKAKPPLHLSCSSNQVSFRPLCFSKCCYALCRPYIAGYFKLWITWNGCIFGKLCCVKVWCWNEFLARFMLFKLI